MNIVRLLDDWCEQQVGRVRLEWGVVLQWRGVDWVPVPDLTYISYKCLPSEWQEDAPCPTTPELTIEIISPGQSFRELTQKATDYLIAGVDRVWVVDTTQSLTIFRQDVLPQTLQGEGFFSDSLLPGLVFPIIRLFGKPA